MSARRAQIPKGTPITGTFPGGLKVAGRTYTVNVWSVDAGFVPSTPWDGRHDLGQPDRVCWVGSGGYWHYADLEDVRLLDEVRPVGVTRADVAAAAGADR